MGTSSPLHTSCQRWLVLIKHGPVLLLPLLSAWFAVSEWKKKSLTPKKAGDKMVKNESPPVAPVTKLLHLLIK